MGTFFNKLLDAIKMRGYPGVVRHLQEETNFLTFDETTRCYEIRPFLIEPIEEALEKYYPEAA